MQIKETIEARIARLAALSLSHDPAAEERDLFTYILRSGRTETRDGVHQMLVVPVDHTIAARLARHGSQAWLRQ